MGQLRLLQRPQVGDRFISTCRRRATLRFQETATTLLCQGRTCQLRVLQRPQAVPAFLLAPALLVTDMAVPVQHRVPAACVVPQLQLTLGGQTVVTGWSTWQDADEDLVTRCRGSSSPTAWSTSSTA
jgi:hypothetical protein